MPFGIEKRGNDYCVVNKATNRVKGRHGGDKKKAIAQLSILNKSMKDAGEDIEEKAEPVDDRFEEAAETRRVTRSKRRKRYGS